MNGTLELLKHHRLVYAIDTSRQRDRIESRIQQCQKDPSFAGFKSIDDFSRTRLRLGGAYVVNVLHTLPTVKDRVDLLESVSRNLRRQGFVLLDVPSYADYYVGRLTSRNRHGDGYLFRQGQGTFTFYRWSRPEELDEWAAAAGFRFDFRITDNHHWVRIYRPSDVS